MVFSAANYEKVFPRKEKPVKVATEPTPAPVGSVTAEADKLEEPEGGDDSDGA